jgi:cephalosporin hydroxylase
VENPFDHPRLDTDKFQSGMMEEYKSILQPLVHRPVTLLEIGVLNGGSILYWDSLLKHPDTRIIGMDRSLPEIETSDRVFLHECDQNDRAGLERIARMYQPFDVIIDDGSHQRKETQTCFDTLYPFLRAGGYYVVEDWAVGYFAESLPQYAGMVEWILELVGGHPQCSFEALRIVCEAGKSMAFFQKGVG